MKHSLPSLLIALLSTTSLAQTVPSSCNAPDSIKQLYQDDADRMALRYIIDNSTTWKDSSKIEPTQVKKYMDALSAVHNAKSLAAVDTVVNLLSIHTSYALFMLDELYLYADSNLSWVKSYMDGKTTTGNPIVDSIMNEYPLDTIQTYRYSFTQNVALELFFKKNLNLFSLASKLEFLSGVVDSKPNFYSGNQNDITDSIYPGFIELTYEHGWVDCIISCWYYRYWVFRVYPDCSVEYVMSYGDQLPADISLKEETKPLVSVYPNPFTNRVYIENLEEGVYNYELYSVTRQKMQNGKLSETREIEVPSNLTKGHYFLKLTDHKGQSLNFQLVK